MPVGHDTQGPDARSEKEIQDDASSHSVRKSVPTAIKGPPIDEVKSVLKKLEPRIAELCSRYPNNRAALLPVLHLVQKEFNWLSPIVQREVAYRLGITPGDVFRVVEFYTLFHGEPCGKKVIMVCGTLSCELAGANKVIAALKEKFGVDLNEPTPDGEYSIERVECLGWCDRAPVMQINDSDFYDEVTPEKALKILGEKSNA